MKMKRKEHGKIIENFQESREETVRHDLIDTHETVLPKSSDNDISSVFTKVVSDRKRNFDKLYEKKNGKKSLKKAKARIAKPKRDTDNFIPYHASDKHTEDGLAINSFERQARQAEFSISNTTEEAQFRPGQKKWDRLKKKMVSVQSPRAGKIKTESGAWIPATYKTGRYADWKEKTKTEEMLHQEMGLEGIYYYLTISTNTS